MKNLVSIMLIILNNNLLYSQINSSIMLKGKIIAEDGTPVQYAHIYYDDDLSKSTISNEEGFFILNISNSNTNDSIVISHVGFETKKVVAVDFDNPIVLYTHSLQGFTVFEIQPKQLMIKVIKNLDSKYFSKSFNAKGFFRVITLENNKGVLIEELAFNSLINKTSSNKDRIQVLNGRQSIDYRITKAELITGVPEIFSMEPTRVKKKYLSLLNIDKYDYKIISKTNYENKEVYVVEFSNKKCNTCKNIPTRVGNMLIDSENFSILEMEYLINQNRDIKNITKELLGLKKTVNFNTKNSIKIKYTSKNGFYYPFFYNITSNFLLAQNGKITEIAFLTKMLINDVTFFKVKKVKNNYKKRNGLKVQTRMKLDNEFYGVGAYILPSKKESFFINDVLKNK